MGKLTVALAITTLAFGASTAYLLSHRGGERESPGEPQTAEDAPQDELARLRTERDRLAAEVSELRDALEADERPRAAEPARGSARSNSPLARVAESWRPPELSPEQRSHAVVHRNGELFRELALSQAEVDSLAPVLAAQDARAREQARAAGRVRFRPGALTPEEEQRNRDEIAAVIGQDKAAQLEALQKTLPMRSEVRMLRNNLEQAGVPISEQQQRDLMAKATARSSQPKPARADGEASPEDALKHYSELRRERAQEVREDAASILTPEQLKVMDQMEELRSTYDSARPRSLSLTGTAGSSAR